MRHLVLQQRLLPERVHKPVQRDLCPARWNHDHPFRKHGSLSMPGVHFSKLHLEVHLLLRDFLHLRQLNHSQLDGCYHLRG
jgi:hypothetical protein